MRRAAVLSIAAIVTLSACHGSDPVTPSADGSYELSSLNEVCNGSLSARSVVDRLSPEYSAILTYHDRPGTTLIRIRVLYEGGNLACMPHQDAPAGTRGPSRSAFVTIDARLELMTTDSALNESWSVTLSGANGTAIDWKSPELHVGELRGTWDPALPGYEDVSFSLAGAFDGVGTSGTLIKRGQRPGYVPEVFIAASWRN